MNRLVLFAGMAMGLMFPLLAQGQETGLLRMNREKAESRNEAAVWGGVEEGGFRPTYTAQFQWSAGAEAKTVRHGNSTSWTGLVSFEQRTGTKMTSSMFLEPGYFPLDIVEGIRGLKSRQTVRVEAGFLTDLGYEWAAGLKASVKGMNATKRQAMQHSAFGLDMQVEPTLTYVMDDDMGLVSTYLVRVRTEQVKVGLQGDGIMPFLDKGMRYGAFEDALSAFPVMEFSHGFNEQIHGPDFSAGIGITWKRGQAGKEDRSRFRFPGSTLKAFAEYTNEADRADHVFRAAYQRQRDQLRENARIDGEATGGYTPVSDRRGRDLDLRYEARFLHGAVRKAGIDLDGNQWFERVMFGHLGGETNKWYDGAAKLFTSVSFGPVDLDLEVLAARGWWKDRDRSQELVGGSATVDRMLEDWLKNMDYRTAPRMGMGGTLTVHIPGVQGLYAQLYGYWHHAFTVSYLPGKNREIGTLKIGYQF